MVVEKLVVLLSKLPAWWNYIAYGSIIPYQYGYFQDVIQGFILTLLIIRSIPIVFKGVKAVIAYSKEKKWTES